MKKKPKILAKYCRPHNLSEFSFADKFTQKFIPKLPISISNALRNNFEQIVDHLTKVLISILVTFKPQLILRFFNLKNRIKTIQLNVNDNNNDFYKNNNNNENNNMKKNYKKNDEYLEIFDGPDKTGNVLIFVHGGAWGSGKPWMYRLVAEGIAKRIRPCTKVILLGYPLFPKTYIDDQVLCCRKALLYIHGHRRELGIDVNDKVILCGHSSGANVCALSICGDDSHNFYKNDLCHGLLLMSGVFDIEKHYSWEASRGLHLISPMGAAARSFSRFWESSPTILFRKNNNNDHNDYNNDNSNNDHGSKSFFKKTNTDKRSDESKKKSNTFVVALIHAVDDDTVPFSSSEDLAAILKAGGHQVLTLYPKGSHMDPLMWMMEDDLTNNELSDNHKSNCNDINYQIHTFLSRFSLLLSNSDNCDSKTITKKTVLKIHSKL